MATCNRSVKIMYDLPWGTHRYFMEPLTGLAHTSRTLAKRFLSFTESIRNSSKSALKSLLNIVQSDVRSIAGHNLRTIMLLTGKTRIQDLKSGDTDFEYKIPEEELWRVSMIKELVDIKEHDLFVPGFEEEDIEEILDYISTG